MVSANVLFLDGLLMLLYTISFNISLSKHKTFVNYVSIRQKVGQIFKVRNNYLGVRIVNGEK